LVEVEVEALQKTRF